LSLAECMNDPENRAEILRYARMWMQLSEPVESFGVLTRCVAGNNKRETTGASGVTI
jgi:hypothetical protein